jgi:hypothetical protein
VASRGAWFVAIVLGACSPTVTTMSTPSDATDAMTMSLTDAGPTFDALTSDQACATQAQAHCAKLMTCSMPDLVRHFGDLVTCETRVALACTDGQAAPDTASTPELALTCAAAVTASTCTDFLSNTPPAACTAPPGPLNGTCAFGAQCSTSFCGVGAEALCGTCQTPPTVGESCIGIGCGDTLVCVGTTTTAVCKQPGGLNANCNGTQPCDNGFTCVGQNGSGKCLAQIAALGGQCDPSHRTRASCNTDDGLTCNTQSAKCVAQPLVAAGMPCGLVNNVETGCLAGASCKIATGQTKGTCIAPAADGAACDDTNFPRCFEPARCIPTGGGTAGTCQLPGSKSC